MVERQLSIRKKNKIYCNDFINKQCTYGSNCKFIHDKNICHHFWRFNKCKFGDKCKLKHVNNRKYRNRNIKKNTETFVPVNKHDVDMRLVYNDSRISEYFTEELTSKDVIIIKNLFCDFNRLELYNLLVQEIEAVDINYIGTSQDKLLKPWHENSHVIADDHLNWKQYCPTFNMIINRARKYFSLDVKATRFNWYKDTSQWKPYHFDAAALKPEKARTQNFTLAMSFGATREASFERDTKDKIKISIPHHDGDCYAFCNNTNILWRHGILKEPTIKNEGRVSIIIWGFKHNVKE
jgi:hypothetical protein